MHQSERLPQGRAFFVRQCGKLIKQRYTVTLTSPTTQTFKWETSEDGKTWSTLAQGSSKKK